MAPNELLLLLTRPVSADPRSETGRNRNRSANLLSWSFVCPSVDIPAVRQLPRRSEECRFACRVPLGRTFRPRGFSPPRRFTPHISSGCIATRYRPWGSLRFRAPQTTDREGRVLYFGGFERLPRNAVIPLDEFPSPAAAPHHCGRCLLVVSVRLQWEAEYRPAEASAVLSKIPRKPCVPA